MQETEVIPVKRKRGRPRKIVKESQESQPSPNNVPIPATEAGLLVRPRTRRTLDTTDISRKLEDNEEKIRSQKRSHSQGSSSSEKSQSRNRNASEDSQPATRVTRRSATALNVSISDDGDKHEARNTEENEPGAKRSRRSASKEVVGNLIFTSFENLHEMTSFMDDTDSEKETNRSSSAKPTNENDHTGKTDKHKDDGKPADAPQPIIIPFRVNPQFRTLVRLKSGIQSPQVVKLKRESRNELLSSMHGKSNQDLPSNSAKETPVIKKASKPPPQADETEDQSSKLTPTPKSNYEVRKTSAVLGALHPPVRSTSKGSAVNKSTQAEMNEMQSSSEKQVGVNSDVQKNTSASSEDMLHQPVQILARKSDIAPKPVQKSRKVSVEDLLDVHAVKGGTPDGSALLQRLWIEDQPSKLAPASESDHKTKKTCTLSILHPVSMLPNRPSNNSAASKLTQAEVAATLIAPKKQAVGTAGSSAERAIPVGISNQPALVGVNKADFAPKPDQVSRRTSSEGKLDAHAEKGRTPGGSVDTSSLKKSSLPHNQSLNVTPVSMSVKTNMKATSAVTTTFVHILPRGCAQAKVSKKQVGEIAGSSTNASTVHPPAVQVKNIPAAQITTGTVEDPRRPVHRPKPASEIIVAFPEMVRVSTTTLPDVDNLTRRISNSPAHETEKKSLPSKSSDGTPCGSADAQATTSRSGKIDERATVHLAQAVKVTLVPNDASYKMTLKSIKSPDDGHVSPRGQVTDTSVKNNDAKLPSQTKESICETTSSGTSGSFNITPSIPGKGDQTAKVVEVPHASAEMVLEKADSTPKHKIDSRKASKESQNQDAASVIDALKASPQVKSISSKEQVDKTASNKTSGNSANDLSPKNATTSLPQKRDQHAIDPQDSPLVKKVKPVEADSVSKPELVVSEASVEPKKLEKNAEKLENSAENPIPAPSYEKTPASSADHISVPSPSSRETIRLPDLVSNQAYSSVSSEELERMLNGVDYKNKLTLPQDKRGSGTPERKLTKDDRAEKESPTTRAQPSTGGLPISTGNALLVSPTRDNSVSSSNPNNKCLSPSNVIFVQSRPPTGGQLLSGGADSSQATITVAEEDNASKQIEQTLPPIGPATKIQLVSKERAKDTVTRDMPVDTANVKGKANTPVSSLPSPSKEKAQPHVQHAATPGTQQPNIVFKPSPPPTPKEVPKVASQEKPVDTAAVQPTKALEKSVTLSRNIPPVSPTKSDKETPVNGNKAANPKLQGLISNVIKIKRNENGQFFIKSAATPSTSKSSEKAGAKILVLPPPPENETSNQQPSVQKTPASVGKGSSGPNTKEIPQHHSTQENSTQETVLHDVLDDMIGAVIEGESREKSNEAGAVQTVKDTLPTKQDAEKEIEDKIPSSPKVPMASNSGEMEKTAPPTTKTPEKSNQNPEIAAEDEGNSRNVTENVQEPKDEPLVTPNENSPEESADLNNTERKTSESTNVVEESMEREEPKIRTRGRKRKSSEMKEGNVTKRTTRLSRLNLTEKRDRVVVKYKLLDSGKMNLEDCKFAENLKKSKSEPAKKQKPKLRPPPTAKIFTSEEGSSFQVKLRELREQRRTESAARQQTITKPTEPPPILDKSHAEFAVSALFFKNNENPRAKEGKDMTYEPRIEVDDEPVDEPGPSRIREEAENIQVSVEPNEKQVSGEPEKNQAALLLEENKICEEPNKNQTPEEVLSDCQALNEPENSSSTSESSPEPARLKSGSNQQKRRWAKRRRKKKIVKPTSSKRKWSNARRLKHMLTIAKRKNLGHISKAERELSKLGHVVINVDKDKRAAEVEQASEVACEKEFCKLGCVCQSLKGSMRDEFHCGKEDCLFGCKCAQAGASNCVNDPRVRDRIRDRAPAEKEFINTVIKGSELLVMAERGKRERKVPQRLVCDFVTGEEIESSCSKRARLDDADYPTVRKRLLDEYWEKQLDDRVSNLQSPDILEEPPDGTIVHSHDGEDDGTAIRVHIDGIECVQRQISQFVPRVSPEKEHEEEHEVEPMEHSSDEDGTPKIISIASIAPEEFDKQGASSSRELEIIDEVCIELPTSYAIIEARRNAKIRAKTMLTRFKDSVISAGGFIPSKLYNDKFCTVSWESFIRRLKARSLFVWVETNDMSNQQIALITDYNGPPFVNFVNVFEKAKKEPTNVILEKLNLLPSSPPVPFILWCNGHNWEILGKLSQCCSTLVNPPEPYKPEELLPENIDSKWLSISAVHGNAFSRLLVGTDVVVDYSFICKLKTMSWEQKRPLVATIPKSKKRKFNAPFGFYSPCSKSMVFLGPYDMDETILDMRLVPPNEGFGDPLKMLQVVRLRQLPQVRCDISEVGIWTCPIERVQDVPYCRFYDNGMLIKLPMERNELLIFESAIGVELFLKNITRDLYKTDVEWTKKERGQYKSTSRVMEEFENFEYQLGLKILDEEIASGLSELPNSSNSLAPSEQPEQSGLEHALAICEKYKETQRCPPSPEVQLVYEDSDDEDDQDILGLLERDSDDYKLEMRNAFLDAECLYPAMGDEKFKRTRLVREMANEVMTLQKTAAALEKEKKELEKIKVAHIKKFELLPRDDRMKIVKAIKKLSNAILANKKHMIELEDKSKSKNEDVPVASTSTQNIPVASTSRQTVPAASTSRQAVPVASTSRQTVPIASSSKQTVPGNTSLPGSSKNVAFTGPGTTKVTTLVMPVTSSKDPSQEVARLTQCPAPAGAKYIKLNIKELEKIKNMIATAPPRSKVTINTQGNQVKIVHTTRSNVAETISSNVKTPTPWVKRIPSTGRTNEDSSKELEDNTLDDMPILTPNCNLEENAAAGPMQPRDEGRITIQNPLCSFPNRRPTYTPADFEQAVHLIVELGYPVQEASERFRVPVRTLYNYFQRMRIMQQKNTGGTSTPEIDLCNDSSDEDS